MFLQLSILIIYFAFATSAPPKLIIVGYDGLRWDYLTPTLMPNTWNVAKNGVFARQGIKNQVVTITGPTFYTISTGLYQESSGITGSEMYDPSQQGDDRFYDYFNHQSNNYIAIHSRDARWYKGEPIWLTNQKNGRASGSMWWPMGDARIQSEKVKLCESAKLGH